MWTVCAVWYKVVRLGLTEEVMWEQRPRASEGSTQWHSRGREQKMWSTNPAVPSMLVPFVLSEQGFLLLCYTL